MHEASLIMGMIPILEENLKKAGGNSISNVVVKIGKLSGVEVDIFEFAYEAIKKDFEWLKDSKLSIIEVPIVYRCEDCGYEFEAESFYFEPCPKCGSFAISMIQGEELLVERIEILK